jgi:hypothetical protein
MSGPNHGRCALRSDRPTHRRASLRASVSSDRSTSGRSWSYQLGTIPSALIRDAKVVGFIPSSWAAPTGPETFPHAAFRAARILSASSYRISAAVRTLPGSATKASGSRVGLDGDGSSMLKVEVITARSTRPAIVPAM